MYWVTKEFTAGLLRGLTVSQGTAVGYVPGKAYTSPLTEGEFTVTSCRQVDLETMRLLQDRERAAKGAESCR